MESRRPENADSGRRSSSAGRGSGRPLANAARASLVYLLPYRPDFNPIEQVFAKLRRLLQSAAERTITGLWGRIGQCVDLLTPQECASYLRHAGYRYS